MTFTEQQKLIIKESLKVYSQIAKRQMGNEQYLLILNDMKQIFEQLDNGIVQIEKPVGITDEQFENVCQLCDKFDNKCKDLVAKKFPGKCDPILHYNRQKETSNGK